MASRLRHLPPPRSTHPLVIRCVMRAAHHSFADLISHTNKETLSRSGVSLWPGFLPGSALCSLCSQQAPRPALCNHRVRLAVEMPNRCLKLQTHRAVLIIVVPLCIHIHSDGSAAKTGYFGSTGGPMAATEGFATRRDWSSARKLSLCTAVRSCHT